MLYCESAIDQWPMCGKINCSFVHLNLNYLFQVLKDNKYILDHIFTTFYLILGLLELLRRI